MDDPALPVLAVAAWIVVSLILLIHMWRQPVSFGKRLLWTPILCIPVLGWYAYGGTFELPPPLPPDQRAHYRGKGGGGNRIIDDAHGVAPLPENPWDRQQP